MLNFSNGSLATISDLIHINFSKNLEQTIPISAKIYGPDLRATKNYIDFGTTLVGQQRCIQFVLRNPSSSSIIWDLSIRNLNLSLKILQSNSIILSFFYLENNEHSVFDCDIKSGLLEANKVFINKNEHLVNVFFTAK